MILSKAFEHYALSGKCSEIRTQVVNTTLRKVPHGEWVWFPLNGTKQGSTLNKTAQSFADSLSDWTEKLMEWSIPFIEVAKN